MKIAFTIFAAASFLVYAFAAFGLVLLGRASGWRDDLTFAEYVAVSSNLVPFSEIAEQAGSIISRDWNRATAIRNLFGNLFLFVPLGFYLPYFIRKLSGLKAYAIFVAALIVVIEAAQLLTRRGIFDVDDFILNFTGAVVGFLIFKYTPLKHLFKLRAY